VNFTHLTTNVVVDGLGELRIMLDALDTPYSQAVVGAQVLEHELGALGPDLVHPKACGDNVRSFDEILRNLQPKQRIVLREYLPDVTEGLNEMRKGSYFAV
jgi:hypothetical protein